MCVINVAHKRVCATVRKPHRHNAAHPAQPGDYVNIYILIIILQIVN